MRLPKQEAVGVAAGRRLGCSTALGGLGSPEPGAPPRLHPPSAAKAAPRSNRSSGEKPELSISKILLIFKLISKYR